MPMLKLIIIIFRKGFFFFFEVFKLFKYKWLKFAKRKSDPTSYDNMHHQLTVTLFPDASSNKPTSPEELEKLVLRILSLNQF